MQVGDHLARRIVSQGLPHRSRAKARVAGQRREHAIEKTLAAVPVVFPRVFAVEDDAGCRAGIRLRDAAEMPDQILRGDIGQVFAIGEADQVGQITVAEENGDLLAPGRRVIDLVQIALPHGLGHAAQ